VFLDLLDTFGENNFALFLRLNFIFAWNF